MRIETSVGQQVSSDGQNDGSLRAGRLNDLIVSELHGKYAESAFRGNMFHVANVAAGVAHGTALGTAPPFCLWNPPGSGVVASLVRASVGYVSGTLGAGQIVLAGLLDTVQQAQAPTGGAELTAVVPGAVGRGESTKLHAYSASTIAGTPSIIQPLWTIGAALATSVAFPTPQPVDLDGQVAVFPGGVVALQGIATAGTSPLVVFSLAWDEIPI